LAEVKWIKITTSMFDDEKIRVIESMPDADSILVIWIKLLTLSGKVNSNGFIFLTENIPYTDEMLSNLFSRPLNTVRLALTIFKQFGMVEYDETNFLHIINWDKHQNIEGLDKIRDQNKLRQQRFKNKQKALPEVTEVTLPVTLSNATELELDIELDKSKKKNISPEAFNRFWDKYPKKKSKGQARITWNKIKPSNELINTIMAGLDRAMISFDWTKESSKYIPYPSTWLNAEGWEDEHANTGNLQRKTGSVPYDESQRENPDYWGKSDKWVGPVVPDESIDF